MYIPKRKYYSSRLKKRELSKDDLWHQLKNVYKYFLEKDYFIEQLSITTSSHTSKEAEYRVFLALGYQIFPFPKFYPHQIPEDEIFDIIEFLYDHVSKPGEYIDMIGDSGYNYQDYEDYDKKAGRCEFRCQVNVFLNDYKDGFELSEDGKILALGKDGLEHILNAEIVNYDYENVDKKVKSAILKWRNRHLDFEEKKQAIIELSNVFEWLKKTGKLNNILDKKDESALFDIANNFGIRHHNPNQKINYDKNIWYSWIFHFYLATYHAVIRLIEKNQNQNNKLNID